MQRFCESTDFVTVVGAGGVGKTRIAVQTGSDLFEGSPDGVWLVDLAPHCRSNARGQRRLNGPAASFDDRVSLRRSGRVP